MKNLLTKEVIKEIQDYLGAMEWSQNDYRIDQLQLFLKGVSYALYDKGVIFEFVRELDTGSTYYTHYAIDVFVHKDPTDCFSGKEPVFRIYNNRVEYI